MDKRTTPGKLNKALLFQTSTEKYCSIISVSLRGVKCDPRNTLCKDNVCQQRLQFRQYSQPIMARTWHVSRATITFFFLSFIPFFASLKCVTSKERIGLPLSASDGAVSNIYSPPVSTRGKLYVPVETTRGHNAQSNYKPSPIAQCKYIKWKKTADCNLRQNLRITQCPSTFPAHTKALCRIKRWSGQPINSISQFEQNSWASPLHKLYAFMAWCFSLSINMNLITVPISFYQVVSRIYFHTPNRKEDTTYENAQSNARTNSDETGSYIWSYFIFHLEQLLGPTDLPDKWCGDYK